MCGLVGYYGPSQNSVGIVLEGLKRLEYRGYDITTLRFSVMKKSSNEQ